jgi:hypothetical protein
VSLVLVLVSLWPVEPLARRAGWGAAVERLSGSAGPADFVVVWPPEQAAALSELPPALRAADAVPVESPGRRRYPRMFVIGPAGFDTPPELGGAEASRERFDDIEIGTFTYPRGDRVALDLRSDLAQARVELHMRAETITCDIRRPDGGWDCPGRPEWNHVAPTSLVAGGNDWPCVWAHPLTGSELVIDLGQQNLSDRVEIEAAMADEAVAMPNGASVKVLLEVDGAGTRRLIVPNRRGIVRASLRTDAGRRGRVRIVITTANDGRRHLGINLRLIEAR